MSQKQIGLRSTWFQYSPLTSRGIADKWCFSDSQADGSFSSVQGVPTTRDSYRNVNPRGEGRRKQLPSVVPYKSEFRMLGEVFVVLKHVYWVYHNEAHILRVLTKMVRDDIFTLKGNTTLYGWHFWLMWWQMTWTWYPAPRFLFKHWWRWPMLGEACYYKPRALCNKACGMV